jgi:DUF1680 family protein
MSQLRLLNPKTAKFAVMLAVLIIVRAVLGAGPVLVPDKVPCVISDKQDAQPPNHIHLNGWLGERIAVNESNRLVKLDPNRLLEGYRKRPGRQSWDGEHVGKWLHAATLAWVNTGDPALREKLDSTVGELVKCQLEDGYLGTYLEANRWTEWDVWAHKYNLIGLLTYMRYTGNLKPLSCCRRMGDLLCQTFGDEPGKRDIIKAGEHVGLAPTSVLEPMVLLYRSTGEPRYLDFCKYILRAWEQPNGPKVISTLLTAKRVDKVGNGKAYEMLSCLNGALEYYRTVGDDKILEACLNAWQDIVDHRLYITGAASYHEVFHGDFDLPNVSQVGETCVTVTWLQFNAQLLRLTGEVRFAEQLEHVILNQLFGAQRCDGSAWGYYVEMEGKKPYSSTLDGHCCLSSGPRGVALIPTFAVTTDDDGVVVNLFDSGTAHLKLRQRADSPGPARRHSDVSVSMHTMYPADGRVRLRLESKAKDPFELKLRVPAWSHNAAILLNGKLAAIERDADGYFSIKRKWKARDVVELKVPLEFRVVVGDHKNAGKIAILHGPLVLAADEAVLGVTGVSFDAVKAKSSELAALKLTTELAPAPLNTWPGAQVFRMDALIQTNAVPIQPSSPVQIRLVPFADAGQTGAPYKVWLPLYKPPQVN